jgi:cAMP-dependent protein kinase regulator
VAALLQREPAVVRVLLRFLRDRLFERLLRTSPLFAQFSEEDRRSLASRFRFLEVGPRTTLIPQGKRSAGLYVFLSGRAEAIREDDGKSRLLTTLGPGDVCGEMSLLAADEAVCTIRTVGKALIVELPASVFRDVIMTHPQILQFVGELAEERKRLLTEAVGKDGFGNVRVDLL